MKKRQLATAMTTAVIMLLACFGVGIADLYFESEQITKGIPNQSDGSTTIKQYLSTDATMTDMGDTATIIDMKQKMLYELDRETKTYRVTEIDKLGGIPGLGPEAEEMAENPMFQAMMKSMAESFKVTPTNEFKTIAGFKCRKYLVDIMMSRSEYWVTKDFDGYDEMKTIGEKSARLFMDNPMMKQMNLAAMMDTLDGYPVQTVTEMMGGTITTTLKKMTRKTLDPSLFKVPENYRRVTD